MRFPRRVLHLIALALLVSTLGFAEAESLSAAEMPAPRLAEDRIELRSGELTLPISLACPRFVFASGAAPVSVGGAEAPTQVTGEFTSEAGLVASYAPLTLGDGATLEVKLHAAWSASEQVLRKWVEYRLNPAPADCVLKEIVFDQLAPTAGQPINFLGAPPQSLPGFLRGFFAAVEFPVASTRLEGDALFVASSPGRLLQGDTGWLVSRKALYGAAPAGRERETFLAFIASHRPTPSGLHFNYNSWYTLPWPYSEKMIQDLMRTFDEKLTKPHGAAFDSFAIDMGWSDPKTLWEINTPMFPRGFANIKAQAEAMDSMLGLWISPTSCYPPALDNEWAKSQGYETYLTANGKFRACCLGGPKYAEAFKRRLVELASGSGVRHFKLDGYWLSCPEKDHGHQPGADSAEAIAEGGIRAFEAVRAAVPDVWLEPTCFGPNPSPFWLYYVNSVTGTFGDDNPPARVPCPIDRESMTTARDYFNLQGAALLSVPIVAQEVLGIHHQTEHPPMNDAVDVVLRGHAFISMYVNPRNMNPRRWAMLADLMTWARANEQTLAQTTPLLPEAWRGGDMPHFTEHGTMPRQPYGYLHWADGRGLLLLRNPWVKRQSLKLDLAGQVGVPAGVENLAAVSLYPEVRLYAEGLSAQSTLEVELAPYETVLIQLAPDQPTEALKPAAEAIGGLLSLGGGAAQPLEARLTRVEFNPSDKPALGPDWTAVLGDQDGVRMQARGTVRTPATPGDGQGELMVILEGKGHSPAVVRTRLTINGKPAELAESHAESIWVASFAQLPERWTILRVPLNPGDNAIDLDVLSDGNTTMASCWAWAYRNTAEAPVSYPNALPMPEQLYLDSLPLLDSETITTATQAERMDRPVERINGAYLDSLTPTTYTQQAMTLQRNKSVSEKPLFLFNRQFARGLGTHANARFVYDIAGKGYKRFKSWVGGDAGNQASTVTFTILVDGVKRWESGYMSSQQPGREVEVDVTGARTLELLVGDGGNGIGDDHADFGDARLLRD